MTADSSRAEQSQWRPAANPWLIAVIVTLAAFMEILDTTIVNVSLPHIAGTLSVSYDEATWVSTSYLVANAIVLPISAFLGRLLGRKRYFVISIIAFTAFSFLCGMADSLPQLIVFRVFQGFFGGGLQPNQQSIILDTFPPAMRGRAFGLTAIATIVAPVLGPTLGGLITDHFSWRWVFFINVPVGLLATFAVISVVEDPPWAKKTTTATIDYVGIGLIALTFAAFQIMLDRGEDADWFSSSSIVACAAIALVGGAVAIGWLLYAEHPVVDIRVMKDRNFTLGCVAIGIVSMIIYGSAVLIPQLAQVQLGYTATLAGLVLSPGALGVILFIPLVAGVLMSRVQARYLLGFGFFFMGCGLLAARNITPDIDYWHLVWIRVFQTMPLAFLFVPVSVLAYQTLPRQMQSDATALYTMFRNVIGSVGISLSTALVTSRTQVHMAYLSTHLSGSNGVFQDSLATLSSSIRNLQTATGNVTAAAMHHLFRTLIAQASLLAYMDVFLYAALSAYVFIPFIFLFSPVKKAGAAESH